MWQFEDSEICSIGMIHPSHSRNSGLSLLSGVSQFSGISTLSGCGSPDALERLPELPASEERRLRRAALILQQRLVLRQWLATHRLQHAYSKLLGLDVSSLEDVYWLEDSTARHVLDPKDFGTWSAARQSLPTGKEALQTLKADLWSAVVKNSKHQDAWTWGGMLVVSVSVCGLVTLAAMTQPSLAPEAKHSLLQYVTGKYLHPPSCKIEWGWEEPQPVGETMCFTVFCYQRNGQPYPICDTDELNVIISHGARKISAVMELGSGDPALAHTARVKFTVRTAGLYLISVTIGGAQAGGGPFRRWFVAGRPMARRSRVGRAPAALVCTAGRPRALHVHPRDQFDNPAPLAAGFSIEIRGPGGEVDEKLSAAASFQYDAVNQRVAVEMCFPEAGVYRAAVSYDGALLHNGEFDCIVLTASEAASVQRAVSGRRGAAAFEARLLGAAKPRRVLLLLSAKQLLLKDYVLKFIPKRVATFRLCPSTKLTLLPRTGSGPGGEFSLDDGAQPALRLSSPQRDLIAAAFTQLLVANCGGEDSFKLKHFELAGKLVGKCLYESALGGSYRQLVRARLTRSFLAQIIGLRVHYKYFEQDDPELYLSKIKYVLETDLDAEDALELTFSDDVYDSSGRLVETRDLVPNGSAIRVSNATKLAYLEALASWRLAARVRAEVAAFLRGLALLVPAHLLAIFDENELETKRADGAFEQLRQIFRCALAAVAHG
ncbi:unnamed protein product, partial [Iphiclides podalirius]